MRTRRLLRSLWVCATVILIACSLVVCVQPGCAIPVVPPEASSELPVSDKLLQTLASHPQWHALLHYDSLVTARSPRSRALPSGFFLSETGRTDPHKELEATLRGLAARTPANDEHVQCRFPARARWISQVLARVGISLPQVSCSRFDQWFSSINPESVTLIFPTSFLNNPASAFGHTFLRLDQKDVADDARLLDYSADFAASTGSSAGLVYAVKGVVGGFDGYYSVAPFARKVEKYSDFENRDIWEYRLNFSREEVATLVSHLWELREMPFTYYYFDENCSYHILALLDVARPTLGLVQSMRSWVIPVDSIRQLLQRPELVQKVTFRPSAATKLRSRIEASPRSAQVAALQVATTRQPIAEILSTEASDYDRALALDLGYDYLTYELIRRRDETAEDKHRLWSILAARSTLPQVNAPDIVPPDTRPEEGHQSGLISFGVGRSEDRIVSELIIRPAFHTLSDPQAGYLLGNQIQFMDTALRFTERRGLELNRLNAIDIMALTPRDSFFQPTSWRVNLSYRQYQREGLEPLGLGSLSVGGGWTYSLAQRALAYGMIDGALEYSEFLDRAHAAGLGPRAGVVVSFPNALSTELFASRVQFITGDSHVEFIAGLSQKVSLARDWTLAFEAQYTDAFQNKTWNPMVRLERFFSP